MSQDRSEKVESELSKEEVHALRMVQWALSDYLMGVENDGFAKFGGGLRNLSNQLRATNEYYEERFNTLEDHECE